MSDTPEKPETASSDIRLPERLTPPEPAEEESRLPAASPEIKQTIEECASDLSEISGQMERIRQEGGWKRFFRFTTNIDSLAEHVGKVTAVQEKSLDLIVRLMGASGQMREDYDTILESIEELSESHSGDTEALDYLVKIKNTVKEIKRRDELLESVVTYTNDLREAIAELEKKVGEVDAKAESAQSDGGAMREEIARLERSLQERSEELAQQKAFAQRQESALEDTRQAQAAVLAKTEGLRRRMNNLAGLTLLAALGVAAYLLALTYGLI